MCGLSTAHREAPPRSWQSSSTFVLVEAKRVQANSFQPEQLAREYVATMVHPGTRTPLILLLGLEPPVLVRGRMSLKQAIASELESVLLRANNEPLSTDRMIEQIPDVVCWLTWAELSAVIGSQATRFSTADPSVTRLTGASQDLQVRRLPGTGSRNSGIRV